MSLKNLRLQTISSLADYSPLNFVLNFLHISVVIHILFKFN